MAPPLFIPMSSSEQQLADNIDLHLVEFQVIEASYWKD